LKLSKARNFSFNPLNSRKKRPGLTTPANQGDSSNKQNREKEKLIKLKAEISIYAI
jgi:hypothetical protein